eukprot:6433543-Alexandrium_andersonii.AAC.1
MNTHKHSETVGGREATPDQEGKGMRCCVHVCSTLHSFAPLECGCRPARALKPTQRHLRAGRASDMRPGRRPLLEDVTSQRKAEQERRGNTSLTCDTT